MAACHCNSSAVGDGDWKMAGTCLLWAQWKTLFQGEKAGSSKARYPISALTCKEKHISAQTLHIYSSQHTQRCKFNKHIGRILSSQISKTFKAKWEYRVSSRSAWETWWDCFIILIKVKKRAENIYPACGRPWVWSPLLQKGRMHSIKLHYSQSLPKLTGASETEINRLSFQKKKKKASNHTQWSKNKNSFKWENCCLNRSTPREPDHKSVIWACFHWELIVNILVYWSLFLAATWCNQSFELSS